MAVRVALGQSALEGAWRQLLAARDRQAGAVAVRVRVPEAAERPAVVAVAMLVHHVRGYLSMCASRTVTRARSAITFAVSELTLASSAR